MFWLAPVPQPEQPFRIVADVHEISEGCGNHGGPGPHASYYGLRAQANYGLLHTEYWCIPSKSGDFIYKI